MTSNYYLITIQIEDYDQPIDNAEYYDFVQFVLNRLAETSLIRSYKVYEDYMIAETYKDNVNYDYIKFIDSLESSLSAIQKENSDLKIQDYYLAVTPLSEA